MTARGGWFAIEPARILADDRWAGLSPAGLGAWLKLACQADLLGEAVPLATAERLGITPDMLAELSASGALRQADDGLEPVEMPNHRRKSESPDAWRERKAAIRAGVPVAEWRRSKEEEGSEEEGRNATQRNATVPQSRIVPRDNPSKEKNHDREYLAAARLCFRCRRGPTENNPLRADGRHLFSPCPPPQAVEAMA